MKAFIRFVLIAAGSFLIAALMCHWLPSPGNVAFNIGHVGLTWAHVMLALCCLMAMWAFSGKKGRR